MRQERYTEARTYFWEVIEGMQNVLGESHIETLEATIKFSACLFMEQPEDAIQLLRSTTAVLKKTVGCDHRCTREGTRLLGHFWGVQRKLDEAEIVLREALFYAQKSEATKDIEISLLSMIWLRFCVTRAYWMKQRSMPTCR
jgi:Tetratricopeptide repeat